MYLNQIKGSILDRVEERIAVQISSGKKDQHQYEAAKLLGIKPRDLGEFFNAGQGMRRTIVN